MHELDSVILTRRDAASLLGVAVAMLLALVLVFALRVSRPVWITMDGSRLQVSYGTSVGDLNRTHAPSSRSGRLLSVDGSVLATEGGAPPGILRNGRPATATQVVFNDDVIESKDGLDAVEATVALREPIPVKTRITGSGPVMRLANPGSVGVRLRVAGSVSGKVVSEKILVKPQAMRIVRTRPRPKDKLVALTFDDGPWPGQTDKILKILEREGVHATFFMVGARVRASPGLAKEVVEAGNLAGNHTLGHRLLTKSKPKQIKRQLSGGASAIKRATGVSPKWFRPPWGAMNSKVWKQTRKMGLHVALWDIDTRDWTRPGAKKIVSRATKRVDKGTIILMHDGGVNRTQTIQALPKIIRTLKNRGYVFVTLEELADAE
jgi:peptidoglycan/xylan/chitin deacetylase (PgdA/CDA1 family)